MSAVTIYENPPERTSATDANTLRWRTETLSELEFIKELLSICSGITVIGAACSVIYKAYKQAKQPQKDIEERVGAIETDIKDIKNKLNNDYDSINQNREDTQLLMRSMFNLIENKITGNNIEGLKKTRDELIQALTEK